MPLDPLEPFFPFMARHLVSQAGLSGGPLVSVADTLLNLVKGALATDLLLAEINPLFLLPDASVVAGDAKVELCDGALFRHPEIVESLKRELEDDLVATEQVLDVSGDSWDKNIPAAAYDLVIDLTGVVGMEDKLIKAVRIHQGGRLLFIAGRFRVTLIKCLFCRSINFVFR